MDLLNQILDLFTTFAIDHARGAVLCMSLFCPTL